VAREREEVGSEVVGGERAGGARPLSFATSFAGEPRCAGERRVREGLTVKAGGLGT